MSLSPWRRVSRLARCAGLAALVSCSSSSSGTPSPDGGAGAPGCFFAFDTGGSESLRCATVVGNTLVGIGYGAAGPLSGFDVGVGNFVLGVDLSSGQVKWARPVAWTGENPVCSSAHDGALIVLNDATKTVRVVKLGADGSELLNKTFPGDTIPSAVSEDPKTGDLLVCAPSFNGYGTAADFGAGAPSKPQTAIARLSATGAHIWTKYINGWRKVASTFDVDGSVFLWGALGYPTDAGVDPLATAHVAKFSSTGDFLWAKDGPPAWHGAVLAPGTLAASSDFNPTSSDLTFWNVDGANGAVLWTKAFHASGLGEAAPTAIGVDPSGDPLFAGSLSDTFDFAAGTTKSSDANLFALRLDAHTGAHVASRAYPGTGGVSFVGRRADGELMMGGYFAKLEVAGVKYVGKGAKSGSADIFVLCAGR